MIREQAAVIIGADGIAQILIYEYFVSVSWVHQKLTPGINLGSNIWLFNYLTETIDAQLLDTIEHDDFEHRPYKISLKLNVSTVMGKPFRQLEDMVAEHSGKIII